MRTRSDFMRPVRKDKPRRPSGSGKSQNKVEKRKKREVPKSEIGLNVDKTFNFTTILTLSNGDVAIKQSKPFKDCIPKEYQPLFLEKCEQCRILCNFSSNSVDVKAKATKSQLLKHLATAFTIPHLVRTMTPDTMLKFYDMIAVNIFRPIPVLPSISVADAHDSLFDSAWPHLSLAYEVLMTSLNCQLASHMTPAFIYKLIGNCMSLDDRERVAVRDIIHALYTKFMNHRTVVREKIAHHFANGKCSSELIQFFVSIVSGFNSPLNPEHVTFYHKYILPLHSLIRMPQFSAPLLDLIIKYVSKSGFLLEPTADYLVKHWPKSHRFKQLLFLRELEHLITGFEIHVTAHMAECVFRLIGAQILNENADVAERAIDILMNPNVSFTMKTHAHIVYPLVVSPAYRASKKHWDDCIRTNAYAALQTLSELDQMTFAKVSEELKNAPAKRAGQSEACRTGWTKVFDAAKNADRSIKGISVEGLR